MTWHKDIADGISHLASAAPGQRAKVTIPMQTGLLMHGQVDGIIVYARTLGVEASKASAGGWFSKTHVINLDGYASDLAAVLRYMRSIAE